MNEHPAKPRSYLETFAEIIRDRRVSHGAFRLWHALRDYTDHASKCFPGQRRLSTDIGCDPHSLRRWTGELIAAAWLKVEGGKPGLGFTYTVLDGTGQPLRKTTSPTVGEKRNTGVAENPMGGDVENHNDALGKTTTKVRSPINQAHLSKSKVSKSKVPSDSGIPN